MLRPFLFEEVKDPSDGTGGGGGAAPFSPDQLQALTALMNSVVTDHMKRKVPSAIAEGIKGVNFAEILAPELAKLKPAEAAPAEKSPASDLTKQLQDMAAKLEAAEAKSLAAERARVEAEQKRLQDAAVTQFRNLIQPKVREDLLDVAVSHWANTEGRLKVAEDGNPTLRVRRAQFKGGPEVEEDLPLAEAITHLLSSPQAKPFIPAPGGQQEKSGPAKQLSRSQFVTPPPSTGAESSDTAKAQATIDALSKLGISDLSEILG